MPPKECPPGKILNPTTNRCVKIDGKIGKSILAGKPKAPAKAKILKLLSDKCNNDFDPISMDNFSDMTEEELKSLVYIGPGEKKNCYLLENIYQVYKTAVLSKKPVRDPMDPSHELTTAEIAEINKMMKKKDPKYKKPKYESPRPYPKGYELEIELSPEHFNYFVLRVLYKKQVKIPLGIIPAWIEIIHTGNADHTSGVLISNIRELWDRKKLMIKLETGYSCCTVDLKKNFAYWQGMSGLKRFIEMCDAVRDKLND